MKVKVLKNILWAKNPPNPGEYSLIEGQVREDLPDHIIEQMLASDTKWIEVLDSNQVEVEANSGIMEDVSEVRSMLMSIVEGANNKNDAKNQLERWGMENLNFDVNKGKKVEDVIVDLIVEYEEQNG